MAENSKIEWTHHTFNPWRGCTKVSPGCANCYAETLSKRNPKTLGIWGDKGTRVVASESYWRQPLKWDDEAERAGTQRRVFCASLADVFEDRPELVVPRVRLFETIYRTPNLDWLLLTKRPQNWLRLLNQAVELMEEDAGLDSTREMVNDWLQYNYPKNIWIGTSVENQAAANERIPHLLGIPAAVRLLSCEPLIGPVDLGCTCWLSDNTLPGGVCYTCGKPLWLSSDCFVSWVIVGGESGPGARPMHPDWANRIRNTCRKRGTAFFFKQWGEWAPLGPASGLDPDHHYPGRGKRISLGSGVPMDEPTSLFLVGKKAAGRLLAGREWDEFPVTEATRP